MKIILHEYKNTAHVFKSRPSLFSKEGSALHILYCLDKKVCYLVENNKPGYTEINYVHGNHYVKLHQKGIMPSRALAALFDVHHENYQYYDLETKMAGWVDKDSICDVLDELGSRVNGIDYSSL